MSEEEPKTPYDILRAMVGDGSSPFKIVNMDMVREMLDQYDKLVQENTKLMNEVIDNATDFGFKLFEAVHPTTKEKGDSDEEV